MTRRRKFCELRLRLGVVAAAALLLVTAAPTAAQQPLNTTQSLYRWIAPTPTDQLAADTTVVPAGMGAVFVPAMTKGFDEPEFLVFQGALQVTTGINGQRLVLAPGSYTLRVGSAPLDQMITIPVDVTAGNTILVPITWGALVVEVVDRNNIPHRGAYELIRVSDRQPYTVGFGADTLVGERVRTILTPPDLFRIVRPGSNYRTRTDFSTVVVPEGSVVYYKLVLDPDSGRLLGAGVVPPEELGIVTASSGWTRRYAVGVGVPLAYTSHVVGTANQTTIGAAVTFDTYLIYDRNQNYFSTIFEVEEGVIRIDPQDLDALPTQKTNDRLRLDALYTRFLNTKVGPYGRFGVLSNLFESQVLVTEPTIVVKQLADGTQTATLVPANNQFRVGGSFAPLLIREGAGANVRLIRNRFASLDWRGGLGFRQNQYNGTFIQESVAPGVLTYSEQEDFNQTGLETTVVGDVRVQRLLLNTNFDLFGDFEEFDRPTLDWRNTLSFRITGALSIDYRLDLLKQPQVTDDTQITQNLLLRYSFGS